MDPLTLIALAAGAGFVFSQNSKQNQKAQGYHHKELEYSSKIVPKKVNNSPTKIEVLPEYKLVKKLVDNGFPFVFVTGGAGTGKSTFIEWLQNEYDGKALLVAPTGMAAINVGGRTFHSTFGLPPSFILKKDIKTHRQQKLFEQAKLLIIDEVSMVDANLLDGTSAFLKKNRNCEKPFGGIQVVCVGDLFQLPPVVSNQTKGMFERIYGTPQFFNSRAMNGVTYYGIELKKTFRQSDQVFIDLLSNIREGKEINHTLNQLNSACQITTTVPGGAVWLSTTNQNVSHANELKLNELNTPLFTFTGEMTGRFKGDRLPSPKQLKLKVGAQVVFTVNDRHKRWVNGTIGIVEEISIEKKELIIRKQDNNVLVEVGIHSWEEYDYRWNNDNNEIERVIIGGYKQFPVILGWAMTIHKSQGRTLDKVHVDLGSGAFATGQVYVALSRCRTLDGLSLCRPIKHSDILIDNETVKFYSLLRAAAKNLPPDKLLSSLSM